MRQTNPFISAQNIRKPVGSHIYKLPLLDKFLQGQTNNTSASVHLVTDSQKKRSHKRKKVRRAEEGTGRKKERKKIQEKKKRTLCSAFSQFYCINPMPYLSLPVSVQRRKQPQPVEEDRQEKIDKYILYRPW